MIEFTIKGEPKSKQRPIFSNRNGKVRVFTGKATASFENHVKLIAEDNFKTPFSNSVGIHIKFYLHRPKYLIWKTKPMPAIYNPKRPDIDNLIKSVVDGLNGIAFKDDAQIVNIRAEKLYHSGDGFSRTEIKIWEEED